MDDRLHKLFHTLWTKAVGKRGYDKKEWIEFEALLNKVSFPKENEDVHSE